jgi:hypothetical protein
MAQTTTAPRFVAKEDYDERRRNAGWYVQDTLTGSALTFCDTRDKASKTAERFERIAKRATKEDAR